MFGLILSAPAADIALRAEAAALLDRLEIPLSGMTEAASPLFTEEMPLYPFLFAAVQALLTPGTAIPAVLVVRHLSGDAFPGDVLRRYVFLQLSLLPYLRVHTEITSLGNAHLLGDGLLVLHHNPDGGISCALPGGTWLELYTGYACTGQYRKMQSINQPPVLVRAGTLLPIGVNDRRIDADDADRLTLHWYEPCGSATCKLQSGESYTVQQLPDGSIQAASTASKTWHLIVHHDGLDMLLR